MSFFNTLQGMAFPYLAVMVPTVAKKIHARDIRDPCQITKVGPVDFGIPKSLRFCFPAVNKIWGDNELFTNVLFPNALFPLQFSYH